MNKRLFINSAIVTITSAVLVLTGISLVYAQASAGGTNLNPPAPAGGTNLNPVQPAGGTNLNPPPTQNNTNSGSFYLQNPLSDKFTTVGSLVDGFMQILSYLAVLFAVLMLIWVGLQFVMARGNPERMKELKNWLLYIVVGVAIVIGARIIVAVVINTLEATGTVNQNVIDQARSAAQNN